MREFLYIGQRTDTKEWVAGCLTADNDNYGRCYFILCPGDGVQGSIGYKVDPDTVRAYTGKRDRKGQRIFEESVCRFFGEEGAFFDHYIKWDDSCAGYVCVYIENGSKDDLDDFFCENCEVLGMTIYTEKKPQTNYEHIRNMPIEKMAELLCDGMDELGFKGCSAEHCAAYDADGNCGQAGNDVCRQAVLNWLKSEVW